MRIVWLYYFIVNVQCFYRRNETERLATLLRTKRYSETAEPYHAGLTAHRRKSV